MKPTGEIQYLLALGIAAIGPWIIWPGAELCQRLWGRGVSMVFLVVSLFAVIFGVVITSDRIRRYRYLIIVFQFTVFMTSLFLLKYMSYLSV